MTFYLEASAMGRLTDGEAIALERLEVQRGVASLELAVQDCAALGMTPPAARRALAGLVARGLPAAAVDSSTRIAWVL